ncbi:MAG TPA: hypothetical protein VJQ83_04345 [Tepidiformaceae bacterium]|nr:hypothetical protein [Tepidiformaceae bacterium]
MSFFYGEFPYTMDDRNRVPIPPSFRDEFDAKGIVMAPGEEPCIVLSTREAFEAQVEWLRKLPRELDYVRDAMRQAFARVRFAEKTDGQHRVTLEQRMVDLLGLDDRREVLVVGADDSLEIWGRAEWEKRAEERAAAQKRALDEVGTWRVAQLGIGGTR